MSVEPKKVRIDKLDWYVNNIRQVEPLCPKHNLRMQASMGELNSLLRCEDCRQENLPDVKLPRSVVEQRKYVLNRIDAKFFKGMKVLNLDDEAVPLAEKKISTKDDKHFITAILTESKVGQRLVLYVGEKGRGLKTQIFVEPKIKRLAFDQNDLHPSDVFIKVEAQFEDGTITSISRGDSRK